MKILFSSCCFLLILLNASAQRDVTGDWLGKLDAGVKLRLVMHINKDAEGKYSATMDSPDQGAKGIKVSNVKVSADSLTLEIEMIKGGFYGALSNDTTAVGMWSQGLAKLPLTIRKTKEIAALKRPQTPKPPFSYKSEDVEYDNADNSIHFGATFTYPSSAGTFPAVILLTGSGQQNRDETIFEHKPFAVIADYLTRQGFAVLRIDDRGIGKTTGSPSNATSEDYAKDAEAGIAFLQRSPVVDKNKIGLLGHSEGGLIAEILAARRKDINFIVLLAGPGVKGVELMGEQAAAVLKSQGFSPEAADAYKNFYITNVNNSLAGTDSTAAIKKSMKDFDSFKKSNSEAIVRALQMNNENYFRQAISAMIQGFSTPWMKYFMRADPQPLLAQTSAKVLALNGEKDIQVISKQNLEGIKTASQNGRSKTFEVKEFPGLNHLFQHCTKCNVTEYGELEETISPEVLDYIGAWLRKNVM